MKDIFAKDSATKDSAKKNKANKEPLSPVGDDYKQKAIETVDNVMLDLESIIDWLVSLGFVPDTTLVKGAIGREKEFKELIEKFAKEVRVALEELGDVHKRLGGGNKK